MSKIVIDAQDVGIRFKISKFKRAGLRERLFYMLKKDEPTKNKDFWALRNLSFQINEGDILGVVGTNGAGKSTLLRTIGGIYLPDEGSMQLNATVSTLLSLGTGFKEDLSGLENIMLNGVIMGFNESEIKLKRDEIIEFAELGNFIHHPVKYYSSGMRARLGFSIAVHLRREIMLIDEVLGVGDFKFRKKSQDKMRDLVNEGRTIIIVSHNLESIEEYSNKCLWLDKGQLKMFGNPKEVLEAYQAG